MRHFLVQTIGVLRVLNQVIKTSGRDYLAPYAKPLDAMIGCIKERDNLLGNTVVRQLMAKFICRRVLSCLPPRAPRIRAKGIVIFPREYHGLLRESLFAREAKVLVALESAETGNPVLENEDFEVSVFVEESLEDIFAYLQDRDTIVRWSTAKGLSRISERLPRDFNDQVFDHILSLFEIHTLPGEGEVVGGVADGAMGVQLPASAESIWHGASLAAAEFARRGLVSPERLSQLMKWMAKARICI